MTTSKLYAQGDILLEPVDDRSAVRVAAVRKASAHRVILAHGEVTGHTHRIERGAVMFRDDGLARDIPAELYIGHIVIRTPVADLVHEEHATITLPRGVYRVRRQREFDDDLGSMTEARLVTD